MPDLEGNEADALARWAGEMLDRYTDCRLRHKALSDWARAK